MILEVHAALFRALRYQGVSVVCRNKCKLVLQCITSWRQLTVSAARGEKLNIAPLESEAV